MRSLKKTCFSLTLLAAVVIAALALAPAQGAVTVPEITTVAGTGTAGYNGDSIVATEAKISSPRAVAATPGGGFLIADSGNDRIRRVSPDGTITTVAGSNSAGFSGDGGPATEAQLSFPFGVAATPDGGFLIADSGNDRIRRVSPDGTITTVAGSNSAGFSGDGGPATEAQLSFPRGVAATPDGGFLIADTANQRIRRVAPDGTITTVAGSNSAGFSGDGGAATEAKLSNPIGVSPTPDGGFLIADRANQRIRRVAPGGTITTVAGTGTAGFNGDSIDATAAQLSGPTAVSPTPDGGFLIADTANQRIRRVAPDGTITTVAGSTAGFSGDGGPATAAQLSFPIGVAATPDGGFLIADFSNDRIRFVDGLPPDPIIERVVDVCLAKAGACDVTPPGVSALKVKRGKATYRLSEVAVVSLRLFKKVKGGKFRKAGKPFSGPGRVGSNKVKLPGAAKRPGRYRLALTATDGSGNAANAKATFVVKAARRKAAR